MAEAAEKPKKKEPEPEVLLGVAPGPHIASPRSTRSVMADVLIALAPAFVIGCYVFRWYAVQQVGLCVVSCVVFEALWQKLRGRAQTIGDLSAAVTGVILGMSIPWTAPWYVAVVGSGAAILIAKMLFGGLGSNIFNPAMARRAFLQACFAGQMTTYFMKGAEKALPVLADTVSSPTPMAAGKFLEPEKFEALGITLRDLAIGTVNGSVGETSAIACIIGGLYLVIRRTAGWRIPLAMPVGAAVVAGLSQRFDPSARLNVGHHLLGGGMLFGAAFIVTDPATSPLSKRGRWIYGAGVGVLVMLIRLFASVPEGVMYSVLVMNTTVPLIDRWTVPRPVGGRGPKPEGARK